MVDGDEGLSAHRSSLQPTTMSQEATRDLSIQDLLRMLGDKLSLECSRIQRVPLSRVVSTTELELEVSIGLVPTDAVEGSNSSGLHRLRISKLEHAMF